MHIYICAYICICTYLGVAPQTMYGQISTTPNDLKNQRNLCFKFSKFSFFYPGLSIYRRILGDEIFEFRRLRMKNLGRRNISVSSPKDKKLRRRNKYLRRRNIVSSPQFLSQPTKCILRRRFYFRRLKLDFRRRFFSLGRRKKKSSPKFPLRRRKKKSSPGFFCFVAQDPFSGSVMESCIM